MGAVPGTVCAAVVLFLAAQPAAVTPVLAQATSAGCAAVNAGTFDGTLGPVIVGSSGSVGINPGPFTPGDVVRLAWTGMSYLLIQHNGGDVHDAALTTGSLSLTIAGPNDTLRWSGLGGATGATMTVTCTGLGQPSMLSTPSTLTPTSVHLLQQNADAAVGAIEGDRTMLNIATARQPAAFGAWSDGSGGTGLDGLAWTASASPLAFLPSPGGLFDALDAGSVTDMHLWTAGSISGLTGMTSQGVNGRIDLGATVTPLGDRFTAGGFIGWDGGTTTNATTGGTTAGNALHFGGFGTYRLPSDIVLSVTGGAAFGALTSTLAGDSGTTGTQRAFLSASIGGTVWSNGPWTVDASGSIFAGAEHQNAFTTNAGVAVPEQTVTRTSASANARVSYALPTELPVEVFATAGLSLNGGTVATGLAGNIGGGVTITRETLRMSVSATYGGIGSAIRTWSLRATLGMSF